MKKRSIAENLFYNMLYQVLSTVLPIITTPYVSRTLGLTAVGIHSYTESIVTYFTLFGALGTSMYGVRKIAAVRDNEDYLAQSAIEIFILKVMLTMITLAVYIPTLCINSEYAYLYRIHIVNIVATGLDISWFYQGIEDFKKVTIRNIFVRLIFIVALFVFVREPADLPIYVLSIVGSTLVGNLIMIASIHGYVHLHVSEKLLPFRHLKGSVVLFVPQIMNYVYVLLDRTLLGWMTNTDNVGIYDQAQRLVRMIAGVMQTLGYVMMARISSLATANDKNGIRKYIQKSVDFTLFLAFPAMMGIIAVAGDLIPLFLGDEFLQVIPTLRILSVVIITASINSILGVQLLIPLNREKAYTIAMTVGAFVNILINVCLIPLLGVYGSCVASIVAECTVMMIGYWNARDIIDLKQILQNNAWVILGSMIMCSIVLLVSNIQMNVILKLLFEILVGLIVYFAITYVTKNEILFYILRKIRNMIYRK